MAEPLLPSDYQSFLNSLKEQVQQAQLKALVAVNRELILLYWRIGRSILERQAQEGWGAKVIDKLSQDLHAAFPSMRGFSPRNLKYMRAFAEAYPDEQFVQMVSAQITWSHNTLLLDKVKDPDERLWYMQMAAEHGWSHNVLALQIETQHYHRKGKALTNFKATLPALDSDLANDVLKDPYVFDFVTTDDDTKERTSRMRSWRTSNAFSWSLALVLRLSAVTTASRSVTRIFTLTCCFTTFIYAVTLSLN